MKINWFSPLPPEKTDIGHYSIRILAQLTKYAQINIWTEQRNWDRTIDRLCPVKDSNSIKWVDLNNSSMSVYNIGNNAQYHARIWDISTRHPGIVILHDYHLHHLFGGILKEHVCDEYLYYTIMQRYYGLHGRRDARDYWHGKTSIDYMSENYPLAEFALENALGAIVHTRYAFEKIAQQNQWPVILVPLPYPSSIDQATVQSHIKSRLNTVKSNCRLVLFGYLGPNRRVESVLQALAALRDSNKYTLDIYGKLMDKKLIERKIVELNLQNQVKVHGFVHEEKLDSALTQAHLAINLRYPTMGEASGSQLRIWNHALPSLVTKVGWYAELPDDTVFFVRPDNEVEDIIMALKEILENPERFRQMGEKGKKYLETGHNPDRYAQILVQFAQKVSSSSLIAVIRKLTERIGAEIGVWHHDTADNLVYAQPASALHDLFGKTA